MHNLYVYLSHDEFADRQTDLEMQIDDLKDLLWSSDQPASDFADAVEAIDFQDLAFTAMVMPFKSLISELGIKGYKYKMGGGTPDQLEVIFSFQVAEHAAQFQHAVRARGLG